MISIRDLIEKTTSQSEQQREVRQAERTNLSQMRDAAFEVVTTEPELYQKYLTLQADNIRCSAGNVALTLIQLPDASRIGSIDYWHSVGRYVQDEAMQNGAKVFVPPRNKNARGYFMGVYYDISQTTGRPLEGQAVIPEGSPKLIAALEPLMQGARAALKEDNTLEQSAYYLGRTSNFKSSRISYKGKKKVENPPEKWVTFENTHEAIIDVDLWNAVQKIRSQRRRPTKMGEMGMFSGLAHCADCGAKLYHCRSGSLTYEQECYNCSTHKVHKGCFGHYIRAVVLEQLVLQNLQRVIAYVREDENEFARLVMRNQTAAQAAEQTQTRRLLEKNTRRMNELDTIIQRLYEDNISGKLTDERFKKLSEAYEQEQAALRESVPALAAQLQDADDKMLGVQHFLKAVRKYTQPEKLTAAMLRELVEKVVVYAPDKSSGHRVQRIDVYYTFIGKIDFSPEYSKKGTA